jgi:hypothetical protein
MFHFPAFPPHTLYIQVRVTPLLFRVPGFPIRTSSDHSLVDNSPRPIAVSHVLHRLLMPRHPPCALTHFTTTRCSHPLCNTQQTTTPPPPPDTTTHTRPRRPTEASHHDHTRWALDAPDRGRPKNTPPQQGVSSGPNSVPSRPTPPGTTSPGASHGLSSSTQPPPHPGHNRRTPEGTAGLDAVHGDGTLDERRMNSPQHVGTP